MAWQAITDGFKGSIHSMQESCGLQAKEVVHMMLVTQVSSRAPRECVARR